MRRFVLPVVALALSFGVVLPAAAQEKTARGSVTAMGTDSITVKVGMTDMKFMVDEKTVVEAPGAGTKSRNAATKGTPPPKLGEIVQTGQAVEVRYHDMGWTLHATHVKRVATPGSGGIPPNRASGTVSAISGNSLTVTGKTGGATFTQTYVIDPMTKVVGKGAGTKAAAGGGRASATDLIASGDTVSVSFKDEGGSLRATTITVTAKATK